MFFANEEMPQDLDRYGEVLEMIPPKVRLKVDRRGVADALAGLLHDYTIEDVSVEDPPLEEVIAEMFSLADTDSETSQEAAGEAVA